MAANNWIFHGRLLIRRGILAGKDLLMKIVWRLDTNSAFDVVITSNGKPLPDGTWSFGGEDCFSPSGLWKVNADDSTVWNLLQQKWTGINGGGAASFRGPTSTPVPQPFLAYSTYHSGFVQADIVWHTGNSATQGPWSGKMTYKVIMTDPADPYTWTWVTHYFGSGPAIT